MRAKALVIDKSPKEFGWSFSRLKNFETCARKYYTVDVLKEAKESTVALERGDRLHKSMTGRVQSDTALPAEFAYMERWAKELTSLIHPLQIIQCELQLACSRDLKPTGYFERRVFCRTRIDYLRVWPSKRQGKFLAQVVDYKTGRPQDDDTQLIINAMLVFVCYPDVIGLQSEFLFTEYGDTRSFRYNRDNIKDLWQEIMPRVAKLQQAHETNIFPPTKNGLCREYCPVASCEHYGNKR